MKLRTILLSGVFIILICVFAMHCGTEEMSEPLEKIVSVKLSPVSTEDVSLPVHSSGMLLSTQQMRLSFKTGGIIEKIYVKEGQNVNAGDILAQLELDEIKAKVQQAKSGFEKWQRDYDRTNNLYNDGVATLEQLQNLETQLSLAASTLQIAEFNLEHSTIKAPLHGRILKRLVEENELIGPGHPAFYFGAGREDWIVRLGVADRDIIQLQLDDPAVVVFDAYPNVEFPAKVTEISQAADPQSGAFSTEVAIDAAGHRLAAGFVAQATIYPKKAECAILVPLSAIVEAHGNRGAVYTAQADTARKAPVIIGPILGDRVVIVSGLEDIQHVVTTGAPYLKVGDKVQIMD